MRVKLVDHIQVELFFSRIIEAANLNLFASTCIFASTERLRLIYELTFSKEREVILRNFVLFCLHAKISKGKFMQIVASTNGTSYDTGSDAFENKEH